MILCKYKWEVWNQLGTSFLMFKDLVPYMGAWHFGGYWRTPEITLYLAHSLVLRVNLFEDWRETGEESNERPWMLLSPLRPALSACYRCQKSWWWSLLSFYQNLEFSQFYHGAVCQASFLPLLSVLCEPVEFLSLPPNAIQVTRLPYRMLLFSLAVGIF